MLAMLSDKQAEPTAGGRPEPRHPSRMSRATAAATAVTSPGWLTVGRGLSLTGEITAGERLVVEGEVRATLSATRAIEVAATGRFTAGKAEVEEAEISGVYEGELTVRGRLLIRKTGRVSGTVRYGEVEIERGGKLSGAVSRLEPASAPDQAPEP